MDRVELRRVFQMFDRNKDGKITKELEFSDSLENLGTFIFDEELTRIIESIDVNGDGFVDIDEFDILYETIVNEHNEEDMMESFKVFDQNNDGFITFEELKSVLSSLGLKEERSIEDCKKMINADGDGRVNLMEFMQMMKSGGSAVLR